MSIQTPIVDGSLWLLIAIASGGMGGFIARRFFKSRIRGLTTDGIVVGQEQKSADFMPYYFPKVQFQAPSKIIIFTATAGSDKPAPVGREVKVLYLASNPVEADIKSTCRMPFMAGLMFLWMIAAFVMSLICYAGFAVTQSH
jgi:hypothetical protein